MAQALLNGLVSGFLIALPAIALSLTHGILNFANYSIGAMITVGAYLTYFANTTLGAPILPAVVIAAVALGATAVGIHHGVYLRVRNADHVTLLVASMGVAFVLESAIRFIYGADVRGLDVPVARPVSWHGLRLNHEQFIIAVTALSAMAVVALVLTRTQLGRAMRAVADDADLAEVRGIAWARTVDWTWAISGVLAALAGVLIALDGVVDPVIGTNYLVSIFAAAVIGGIGNPYGAVAGALIIGLTEEISALVVSTTYRQSISFILLILVLLLRPQGLLGVARTRR
jgi:branched-subunit amino acid ABC-type transport system permease component